MAETRQGGIEPELDRRQQTLSRLPAVIDRSSSSDVLQRLVWLSVHLFLAGGSIPVSCCTSQCLPHTHRFLFSQVIENVRRQSVEGLALPFLINWLLGIIDTHIYL